MSPLSGTFACSHRRHDRVLDFAGFLSTSDDEEDAMIAEQASEQAAPNVVGAG
jgi:hypothetical protein